MDNTTQTEENSQKLKKSGIKKLTYIILNILLIGILGTSVYVWQQGKITNLNDKITELNKQVSSLGETSTNNTDDKATSEVTSADQQVLAAVKAYCNANVDQTTKQPLMLTIGKAGPNQKQVLYSSDKLFAYVNAICNKDGSTEGSGSAYYLKKVNETWIFLYRGQESSPEYSAQFNIPSVFN